MDVKKILELVVKAVRMHLDKRYKIYLFGSQSKNRAGPHSDLDIALLGDRSIQPMTMVQIKESMDQLPTLRTIDVLDLRSASRDFREAVLKEGILMHE